MITNKKWNVSAACEAQILFCKPWKAVTHPGLCPEQEIEELMKTDRPDWQSVMQYVSQIYKYFETWAARKRRTWSSMKTRGTAALFCPICQQDVHLSVRETHCCHGNPPPAHCSAPELRQGSGSGCWGMDLSSTDWLISVQRCSRRHGTMFILTSLKVSVQHLSRRQRDTDKQECGSTYFWSFVAVDRILNIDSERFF